jgi:hypothetical protein
MYSETAPRAIARRDSEKLGHLSDDDQGYTMEPLMPAGGRYTAHA